jgi:death-on-curing protein
VKRPIWVLRSVVEAIHDAQLAEHGGASGMRDSGLLDSALARPLNLHAHGEIDRCALAASYAFGIVRNHPFVDGNKRTAFLTAYVFLRLNGLNLVADEVSATTAMLALAAGQVPEAEYAAWLRANTKAARKI